MLPNKEDCASDKPEKFSAESPTKIRSAFGDLGQTSPTISTSTQKQLPKKRRYGDMDCDASDTQSQNMPPVSRVAESEQRKKVAHLVDKFTNTSKVQDGSSMETEISNPVEDQKLDDESEDKSHMDIEAPVVAEVHKKKANEESIPWEDVVEMNFIKPNIDFVYASKPCNALRALFNALLKRMGEDGCLQVQLVHDYVHDQGLSMVNDILPSEPEQMLDFDEFVHLLKNEWVLDPVELAEHLNDFVLLKLPMIQHGVLRGNITTPSLRINDKTFTRKNAQIGCHLLKTQYGFTNTFEANGFVIMDSRKHIKSIELFRQRISDRSPFKLVLKNFNK